MITVCFRGGLGNQLYQYAFCKYICEKSDSDMGINDWFYSRRQKKKRGRNLEILSLNISFAKIFHENWWINEPMIHAGEQFEYISETDIQMSKLIREKKPLNKGNYAITGWCQDDISYLGDSGLQKRLVKDFSPSTDFTGGRFNKYRRMISSVFTDRRFNEYKLMISSTKNCVAVHVRRGDYLHNKNLYNTLDREYYDAAFEIIHNLIDDPEFFIFSDEIDRVKKENIFGDEVTYVETGSLLKDFQLFKNCKHNIIANSTYSWWGAYLNENPNKAVVIPKKHFTDVVQQRKYESHPRALPGWHII